MRVKFADIPIGGHETRRMLNPKSAVEWNPDWITFIAPFEPDYNHVTRLGFINCVVGWSAAGFIRNSNPLEATLDLTGKDITLRFCSYVPEGKPTLFIQTYLGEQDGRHVCSSWCSTDFTGEYKRGVWSELTWSTSGDWMWAGNNPDHLKIQERWVYVERPFDEVLSNHRGTLAFAFSGIPEKELTGYIGFEWFEIR